MSDLPGLPPRRTPPSMDPPAGSADRAVRRGAARRRRTAVSAATTFGIAGLATAAVLQSPAVTGSGVDVAGGAIPRVTASGTLGSTPLPSVAPTPTIGVPGPSASGTVGEVVPTAVVSSTPRPDPEVTATETEPAPGSTMRRDQTSYALGSCQDRTSSRTANGWCVNYVGARSGKAGTPVTLAIELCRMTGFREGTASFPTAQEADFTVSTDGASARTVWRWSYGRSFDRTRHGITVVAGTCERWSTVWEVRSNDGRPLNPGTYDLLPDVLADNLSGGSDYLRETFAFTVS